MKLANYIESIKDIFKTHSDKYECHNLASPILQEMSQNKEVMDEIIRLNLSNEDFLKRERHYSTLAMDIFENEHFTLLINIFPPLPDRNTDITFQSIHHHGSLLLSTVGFTGPGYSSILYRKGFEINPETEEAKLEIEEFYQNKNFEVKFCDAYQPHVVFYPSDFSATLVLWSESKEKVKDKMKKIQILSKFKKPIGKMLRQAGLSSLFGLNKVEYFDFYVDNGKYRALKNRLAYDEVCNNDNYLKNIFSYLQSYGFEDDEFIESLKTNKHFPENLHYLLSDFKSKKPIKDEFCTHHLNIEKVNLRKEDLLIGS